MAQELVKVAHDFGWIDQPNKPTATPDSILREVTPTDEHLIKILSL
jgi:hypothetical protein